MATYRLAEILRSRSDFSDDEIARMDEDEAWRWIRTHVSMCERPDDASNDSDGV